VSEPDKKLDQLCVNTIRTLSMDAVQQANSGHPGTAMALAPVVYTLWQNVLRFDPEHPIWPNRDRFVLSIGHASMLIYSMLHLTRVKAVNPQYETLGRLSVTLDDIKRFRQLDSKCPGHPEYRWTSGVETTTGPLGQGVATSAGMAIAGQWMASYFNRPDFEMIDYDVYALCGDGCMMEGVSSEAASLAGHLKLNNLCWIYDNNKITIEGHTDWTFSEDVATRFIAYGWNVTRVGDANDLEMLQRAFRTFKATTDRPTLVIVDSHIAWGAPNKQDTHAAHGEPLGEEEIRLTKRNYGWPEDAKFLIPDGVYDHFEKGIGARGRAARDAWFAKYEQYRAKYPELAEHLLRMQKRQLPDGWDKGLTPFPADPKGVAGRDASGKVLNALAQTVPWLIGGSADLAPSTKTRLTFKEAGDFSAESRQGRNFHFGIREHAMGSILNGMALSKIRAYGSGFMIFSDYMRASIRLSAIMELPVVYIFTHDSIGVGEDGPTHQPIEQLPSLRAIPGLLTFRPADANEIVEAWRYIMTLRHEPVALILSRQALPTVDRAKFGAASGVARGAYVVADAVDGKPDVILLATGSEVSLCLTAWEHLTAEGLKVRVVSMPCWELFEHQDTKYKESVLPPSVRARVAVEQASTFGWARYVGHEGEIIGMKTFGASAPLKELQTKFGFTPDNVVSVARSALRRQQKNPLTILGNYGQSVWLDYIRRTLITSGDLQRFLDEDGLRGVTSNPAIFEKAIAGSNDYEADLKALERRKDLDAKAVYERLAIKDIQGVADALRSLYLATKRRDGYVSLEVSPDLAHDTKGTLDEARRLWTAVGRENVMIKVPATPAGVPAIQQLIAEGINVNVTLLFAQAAYEQVANAYIAGLEAFAKSGGDVSRVASVASFFISRIDSATDALIAERLKTATDPMQQALLKGLQGKVAIANAKLTYQRYKELYAAPRWQALTANGAQTQRLLWASTSTKNPNYRDVVYVEELIGKDTVNTIPPATFDAFRDHGHCRPSLEENLEEAHDTMQTLEKVGISMKAVTDKLLDEAVKLFADAFVKLIAAVSKRFAAPELVKRQTWKLPQDLEATVRATIRDWQAGGKVRRLWARDASLWTGSDEADWLGWMGITDDQLANIDHLLRIQAAAKAGGYSHALLLGMGGSSLCPEVLKMTFGKLAGFPELHVLDSTDPAQIKAFEGKVDLANTLFIVSSKSGSTLEPNIFKQYFFERAKQVIGADRVGGRFIAITDPGSKMQQVAEADRFGHIFFGLPSIGGRFSALSHFGMVPAAVMGLDVARFLGQADQIAKACASSVPVEENPGAVLGIIMGVCGANGRDKVTLITSPAIDDLGAWLEQLLAESTGKDGKGLIPVDREPLGAPEAYGKDRLFVYVRLASKVDAKQEERVTALEAAGQPVVRIEIEDAYDLGAEFFRWEFATAVAGAVLGLNTFNQPDVEASKVATRKLTTEYEKTGALPAETPILEADGLRIFTDEVNAAQLTAAMGRDRSLVAALRAHFGRVKPGDYVALLAYIQMTAANERALTEMRVAVRDARRVATCLGFGPRFLHSTGQAYKGGPNTGVFLQVTCDDAADLAVPGQKYTFGVVKAAQARGDLEVLYERGRRALRVHLARDVTKDLATLAAAVKKALA
jgi:transaldolase/glucose-6-phosphate isomerase